MNPLASGRGMFSFKGTAAEETEVETIGQSLGLSPNDPTLAIEALSGGNQQKVVVGRWLETDRQLLIAEDPTAGVDVGAKAEIYALLFEALASGMGRSRRVRRISRKWPRSATGPSSSAVAGS